MQDQLCDVVRILAWTCGFIAVRRDGQSIVWGLPREHMSSAVEAQLLEASWMEFALLCIAVKELKLNYHNSEAMLFATYPYYGNLV